MKVKFPYGIYFDNYEEIENYFDGYGYIWSYTVWEEIEKMIDD